MNPCGLASISNTGHFTSQKLHIVALENTTSGDDDDEWVEDLGVESTQVLSCKYSILQTNHDWHPIDSCSRVFH